MPGGGPEAVIDDECGTHPGRSLRSRRVDGQDPIRATMSGNGDYLGTAFRVELELSVW